MSAIHPALSAIDRVATEGDLTPERRNDALELASLTDPTRFVLPDGRRIYPPRLHGEPIDQLARALIDADRARRETDVPAPDRTTRMRRSPSWPDVLPTGSGEAADETSRAATASRSTGSSRSPAARPATSTCSATSSSPPPTTPAPSGSSTPRSCRRCARAGW